MGTDFRVQVNPHKEEEDHLNIRLQAADSSFHPCGVDLLPRAARTDDVSNGPPEDGRPAPGERRQDHQSYIQR